MSLTVIEKHADVIVPDSTKLSRPDWLTIRRQGVGGSDAAAVLGVAPPQWGSRFSLWVEKTSTEVPVDEQNDAMKWGHRTEEVIGHGFAEDTGIPVMRYPAMLRSKQWPWMMVNLDFVTADGLAVVECKNVSGHVADKWEDDHVPIHYAAQGQHELAVTGMDSVWFAVLIGGQADRYIRVDRNEAIIEDMVEQERQFWELVARAIPPGVDESPATKEALAKLYPQPVEGSQVDVGEEGMALLIQRANLKEQAKDLKAQIDGVENELRAILKDNESGTRDGQVVVRYKKTNRKGYTVEPTEFRQFSIPKGAL